MATEAEYGSWKSPITSSMVSEKSVFFQQVVLDDIPEKQDTVYWIEMRYDEGGRYVICSSPVNEVNVTLWTPKGMSARTLVHEYGGGAMFVHDGIVYFSNAEDQRLYRQTSADATPDPITPENNCRYADGSFIKNTNLIICVREDHSKVKAEKEKHPENEIVIINPATQQQTVVCSGADFYSSPRVSSKGKLAWVQWNHPNMPWDETELWTADLVDTSIKDGSKKQIVSGVSVIHPRFTCTDELMFISDETGWWNIYRLEDSGPRNLCKKDEEFGLPHWIFGYTTYQPHPTSADQLVATHGKTLCMMDMSGKEQPISSPYENHVYVTVSSSGSVFCVGGSATKFPAVVGIHPDGQVLVFKNSREVSVDTGYLSIAKEIKWTTAKDDHSYGYLYLPQNKDYVGPASSRPPLLVKIHGGPTSQASCNLSMSHQYFTSRGFALLDVNYRGSTGYGRQYRNKLRENWGVCDVEDSCSGAQHLADQGVVDPKRLCIDGGSAGGYTTLACLAFADTFSAGASHYGVGDLEMLASDTHKFESRYLDTMIGPYVTEKDKQRYKERSPINSINKFNCPIALFQGDEDKIVPPNQAELMYNSVKEKKIPCAFVLFKGEQHGFRKAENIETALDGEILFYGKVLGFDVPDNKVEMEIANL